MKANFADAIQESDLRPVERDHWPQVKHCVVIDHPSAGSRLQKTECGAYAVPREIATTIDDVNCEGCLQVMAAREQFEI